MNPKSNSFNHIFHVFFSSFLKPRPSLKGGVSFCCVVFFSKNTCVGETTMLYLNSHEISKEC